MNTTDRIPVRARVPSLPIVHTNGSTSNWVSPFSSIKEEMLALLEASTACIQHMHFDTIGSLFKEVGPTYSALYRRNSLSPWYPSRIAIGWRKKGVDLSSRIMRTMKYNMDAMTELFEAIESAIQELEARNADVFADQPSPCSSVASAAEVHHHSDASLHAE